MPSEVGWLARAAPPPIDATSRFHQLSANPGRLSEDLEVWLVPGIFTERYPAYLRRIRKHLGARVVPIDTDASMLTNAKVIRDTVLQRARPVALIGHSKGP